MLLYIILVCIFSITIGFLLRGYFIRQPKYVGNIVVTQNNGITLFSLELDNGDPETIALEKEVAFRILIPDEESDRE